MKVNSSNRGGAFHKYVDDAFDSNEINNKDNKDSSIVNQAVSKIINVQ